MMAASSQVNLVKKHAGYASFFQESTSGRFRIFISHFLQVNEKQAVLFGEKHPFHHRKTAFSKMADKPYPTLSTILATSGLSIRRQSKNFCKNMLMEYYTGKKKRRNILKPSIFTNSAGNSPGPITSPFLQPTVKPWAIMNITNRC